MSAATHRRHRREQIDRLIDWHQAQQHADVVIPISLSPVRLKGAHKAHSPRAGIGEGRNVIADFAAIGILANPHGAAEQRAACPNCGKGRHRDRALGLNIENGVYYCFRCGDRGNVAGRRRTPTYVNEAHTTLLSQYGRDLFTDCRPIEGAALEYLQARQCVIPPADSDLRYHPKLKHPCGHEGPALVALCTDAVTREPRTLHRTWIRADGKKADLEAPRLLLKGHKKTGAVIRLWPDECVTGALGLAEGIETALCAAHGFTPMWSAIDAGNLERFPVLAGIEALTVFADHDDAGIRAAAALAFRWRHVEVTIVVPETEGHDMADEVAA